MLDGIRVLDTTRLLPGPYASWLLAAMGAEVVKVEQPGRGDYIRANHPRRDGESTVFRLYNRGKRSVALDLKQHEGRAAFLDLAARADVVLDGNRPGVLDRLGCGWEVCGARNAQLVFCAITGFGQDGPYRDRVGHDANYLSYAGVLSGLADRDGRPIAPRVTIADMSGGLAAVGASLAALLAARAGDGGRFVDVSMTDTALSMSGLRLAEELLGGEPRPADAESEAGDDWEYGVYETSDGGWISLDPYELRFKERLWSVVEAEGAGVRPARDGGPEPVRAALAAAIRTRTRARWEELLAEQEVCFAPVYAPGELLRDPNVVARGLVRDDADGPRLAPPVRFDPPPAGAGGARVPRLGEDTAAVLGELGWSAQRIAAAERTRAIETWRDA